MSARILVVEDTPANMKLATLLLTNAGAQVLSATNAQDAIAMARVYLPDLILMDIQLPGMDGMAATRVLKEDAATAAIPVVALTALAMRGERERIMEAGFTDYIAKPFKYQEFLACVARILPGRIAVPGPAASGPA